MDVSQKFEVKSEDLENNVNKLIAYFRDELKLQPLAAILVMRETERWIGVTTGTKIESIVFNPLPPVEKPQVTEQKPAFTPSIVGKDPGAIQ